MGLPDVLARVAERCGESAAYKLAYHYGGQEIYIPDRRRLVDVHRLVATLGSDLALAMHEMFGRGHLRIPIGPLRQSSNRIGPLPPELLGQSNSAIARQMGCDVRSVQRARKRLSKGESNAAP